MCNVSFAVCSCSAVIIAVLAILYYSDTLSEDEDAFWSNIYSDDSCVSGKSGNGKAPSLDRSSCVRDPRSHVSCCSLNPIIKSQVHKMLNGIPACEHTEGPSCTCLPNIGSKYLGATVESIRDTQPYIHPMGSSASEATNKPSLVLDPSPVVVGKNWHFSGAGSLIVKLFYPAHISGFTVVHVPKCQMPSGFETSTLKDFYVVGMNDISEEEPFFFGNYTYDLNGSSIQVFPVQSCSADTYQLIEFRFVSNYGDPDYTAVYKLRIHGDVKLPSGLH